MSLRCIKPYTGVLRRYTKVIQPCTGTAYIEYAFADTTCVGNVFGMSLDLIILYLRTIINVSFLYIWACDNKIDSLESSSVRLI